MNKRLHIIACISVSLSTVAPVMAAPLGSYVGANYTHSTLKHKSDSVLSNRDGWEVKYGYNTSRYLGFEGSIGQFYSDSKEFSNKNGPGTWSDKDYISTIKLAVVGHYPLTDKLDVYGKFGPTYLAYDPAGYEADLEKYGATVGVGLNWYPLDNISFNTGYDYTQVKDNFRISQFNLGAAYHF